MPFWMGKRQKNRTKDKGQSNLSFLYPAAVLYDITNVLIKIKEKLLFR